MIVVERVYRDDPPHASGYGRDTVTLGWEDRTYVHGRRRTDGGVEFGTSLPRGTVLRAGDHFLLDELRLVVAIVERPEPVFVVEPRTPREWALFAYQIGNRHQPVMVADEGLLIPDTPGVERLLQQYQMPYRREVRPFTPVAGTSGHHH